MKKIVFAVIIGLCSSILSNAQQLERHWRKDYEKIRFISYNICDGFSFQKDKDRQERLCQWVHAQNPDVIALQELCGFKEADLKKLAAAWGHDYCAIVKENGYPVGITSKKPLKTISKLIDGYGHGLLHVQTYGYDFLITHLSPNNAYKRNGEAQRIVEYIHKNGLEHNCILAGDMNSSSPFDRDGLYRHPEALMTHFGGKENPKLRDGRIDYSVISWFMTMPLIDICAEYVASDRRETYPTPILMDVSKHYEVRKNISERRDYIFVSPDIADNVVDAFIYNGKETEYLSDHFPIGFEIFRKQTDDR